MAKRKEPTFTTASGTVLTDEILDKLAAEAEAGYDLSKARLVRRGRPSMSGEGLSPKIQVRLDPELHLAVRALAAGRNTTVSELTREALRKLVAAA